MQRKGSNIGAGVNNVSRVHGSAPFDWIKIIAV
jgi:hypothetical protein